MNSQLCARYKMFFLRSKIFIVFISKKEDDTASAFLWQLTTWNLIHVVQRKQSHPTQALVTHTLTTVCVHANNSHDILLRNEKDTGGWRLPREL